MKAFRLQRLFNARSGRCLNVTFDHGFFNEPGGLTGIKNLAQAVATLVAAGSDAVPLTRITHLVRQAVELGADPTDDLSVYHRVVETAGGEQSLSLVNA